MIDDDEPSDGLIYLNGTFIINFKTKKPADGNKISICISLKDSKKTSWESAGFVLDKFSNKNF